MKDFLKKHFTMSVEKVNFYLMWGNYLILATDSIMGFYVGNSLEGFAFALALFWCWAYFAMMKQRDKTMAGYGEAIDLLSEIMDRANGKSNSVTPPSV